MNRYQRLAVVLFVVVGLAVPAFSLTVDEIEASYVKAYQYEAMQKYGDAIKSLSPIFLTYPETYTLNLRLGWLYYLNKDYANSIVYYDKAMRTVPTAVEPVLGKMLPLLAQSDFAKTEELSYQVLKSDDHNYYANLRLAYALDKQKKYDQGKKVCLKMLSLYPTDVSFLTQYALLLWDEGNKTDALNSFWSVKILDPENATAKYYLGR